MKKLLCFLLALICCTATASCKKECDHIWEEANCTSPKICTICAVTEGEVSPSNHSFLFDKCEHCGLIQLTLSNYENYLECDATIRIGEIYSYSQHQLKYDLQVSGNSHYKYNNVKIEAEFYHYDEKNYKLYLDNNIDSLLAAFEGEIFVPETEANPTSTSYLSVKLNLAGNGSANTTALCFDCDCDKKTKNMFDRTVYTITKITGTVEEY